MRGACELPVAFECTAFYTDDSMPTPFSVILPVYNERENIEPLLAELAAALKDHPGSEVVAVDDGSTDGSAELLRAKTDTYPFLRVAVLARNFGQTAAIAAGVDIAKGEVLIPMDADGQNDPQDIAKFLHKIDEGYDVVSGWRRDRHDGWLRSALSRVANAMIRMICGQEIHDYGCTMKAYRRSIVHDMGLYGDMHRFLAAYTALQGARIAEVEVHHRPRMRGKSKYGFGRIWRVFLDLFLLLFFLKSFTRPMHFFGGIGLLFMLLGFVTISGALLWREMGGASLIDTPLPTLAALFVIIGVQGVMMGVLAEMSMRTYFQTQSRKSYIVRSLYP